MLATLIGTPGDDVFAAGPGWAVLNGIEYIGDYDFDGGAGRDIASLYDTPDDDVFTVRPGSAELGKVSVRDCEIIHGYAKAGGDDVAYLSDSDGDDIFIGKVVWGKLYGDDFFLRAKFFETVEAGASGGLDTGNLYDSEDDDVVIMQPEDVTLFGPDTSQRLKTFDYVHAYAKEGGHDVAHLYGERYTGRPDYTRIFSGTTVNRAKFFEEVAANRERVNAPTYGVATGTVTTMTGTHVLRRSIELGSGDRLDGDATLTRGETTQKNLVQNAREGVTRLSVPDTSGYRLGDELTILAYKTGSECVIVVDLGLDWIEIENPLTQSYTVANGAAVVNYFPLIRAEGSGITIEGVTIDGNRDKSFLQWQIIGGGMIHMETTNSAIRDVIVKNSPSTGILMKDGRDNLIDFCIVCDSYGHGILMDQEVDTTVEDTISSFNGDRGNGDGILVNGGAGHLIQNNLTRFNERYGLHPAGELTHGGIWRDNDASENGSNGFHFCYNNFDLLVQGNTLNNNGRSGVGGFGVGGEYADRFNIVTGNVATGNWRYGIETNGGRDNVITFNDVRGNRLGGVLIMGNHIVEGNLE
jgi:parallel beta-helix repeat protein